MAYRISENFTLDEMYSSASAKKYGINNTPSADIQRHLVELVSKLLQPLRDAYGKPITITSGYRCKELNKKVGGSETSAHMTGYAADTKAANMKEYQEFVKKWIKDKDYDQLILEYPKKGVASWLHIGLKNNKGEQRKRTFSLG